MHRRRTTPCARAAPWPPLPCPKAPPDHAGEAGNGEERRERRSRDLAATGASAAASTATRRADLPGAVADDGSVVAAPADASSPRSYFARSGDAAPTPAQVTETAVVHEEKTTPALAGAPAATQNVANAAPTRARRWLHRYPRRRTRQRRAQGRAVQPAAGRAGIAGANRRPAVGEFRRRQDRRRAEQPSQPSRVRSTCRASARRWSSWTKARWCWLKPAGPCARSRCRSSSKAARGHTDGAPRQAPLARAAPVRPHRRTLSL